MENKPIDLDTLPKRDSNMLKHENVLILPYNTLRMVDLPIQIEINKAKGIIDEPIDHTLFKLMNRKVKDLSVYNNIDADVVKRLIESGWDKYYNLAVPTTYYSMLDILKKQKFVDSMVVAFPNKITTDNAFKSIYLENTIESIETYMLNSNITTLVCDDIETIDKLTGNGKVNFDGITIMLTNIAYNFYYDETVNMYMLKNFLDIKERYSMEFGLVNPVSFNKETIVYFNNKINKRSESK